MKKKLQLWFSRFIGKEVFDKRLEKLETRLRDFQENSTVNLYLYVDGEKIIVIEDYYRIPSEGSYMDFDEESDFLFLVEKIIYSELGFCIEVHGQLRYRKEILHRKETSSAHYAWACFPKTRKSVL